MRTLVTGALLCLLLAVAFAADEHRPKKKDDRTKRNLQNQISYHYSHLPNYRLDRRISSGSGNFPNPPTYHTRPYYKGRRLSHPIPPYAVQMDPLIPYSQRDPLLDSNVLSLDSQAGALTENDRIYNSIGSYGPHKPQIIERPVYIKEPEPIIEIIIKESNVSLPAPPPPPPPPKKKKEQVHVFYVKYKKNPNGHGKDSIIYDKPVPALSPKIPDEEEEEDEEISAPYNYHKELATAPPPPSTTLRTIIKPDSEVYHSPSGIKVTFGKEGFDYDKRSSKLEDYYNTQSQQHPQGRQLTSFSNAYYKTPTTNKYHTLPPELRDDDRPRPSFRPITFPISSFGKPPSSHFSQPLPNKHFSSQPHSRPSDQFNNFVRQPIPQFSHSISHPPPPSFQSPRPSPSLNRQPVPYVPFDKFRQQHYSRPPAQVPSHISPPHAQPVHFRPETHFPIHQQLPLPQPPKSFQSTRPSFDNNNNNIQHNFRHEPVHQQQHSQQLSQNQNQQTYHNDFNSQSQQDFREQHYQQNQQVQHAQQNLHDLPNVLPAGGQLIQSVPKFEQHISSLEPLSGQQSTHLGAQQYQNTISQRFNINTNSQEQLSKEHDEDSQQEQQLRLYLQQRQQQQTQQQQQQQQHQQRSNDLHHQQAITTPRNYFQYQSTRKAADSSSLGSTTQRTYQSSSRPTTTTTTETPAPSTTTKDPKVLEAQLPDEVPEELREQLLASGILNNADISILDYDKVGDIPLSALPPDQLANFYTAGGGAQIASGSEPVPSVLQRDGAKVNVKTEEIEPEASASEIKETVLNPNVDPSAVDLKVVHYDPETEEGKKIQGDYVEKEAQSLNPVVLNDNSYNRYLPLRVDGAQFPLPDVPELKNKKISSVVILAPVAYDFSPDRSSRETPQTESTNDLIKSTSLETLMKYPTLESFRKFLEKENSTKTDMQSVILLVFDSLNSNSTEREIFMYDVSNKTVSKLNGELSAAFVEAAEANANDHTSENQPASSEVNEIKVATIAAEKNSIDRSDIQVTNDDFNKEEDIMETQESEQIETVVDLNGKPVDMKIENLIANYES